MLKICYKYKLYICIILLIYKFTNIFSLVTLKKKLQASPLELYFTQYCSSTFLYLQYVFFKLKILFIYSIFFKSLIELD